MAIIYFLIGVFITGAIYVFLKGRQTEFERDSCSIYAKWLSTDKPFERSRGGFIIYANDTRWFLNNYVRWELYWIPFSEGDDLDRLINIDHLEFRSTWLSENKMYKMVLTIINTHPNLRAKGLWKIIKFFR